MTKFEEGDGVEIRSGAVKWKFAVYVDKVKFVGGFTSCGLHLVDFRASPTSATVRLAVTADRLRRALKPVPVVKPAKKVTKPAPVVKTVKKPTPAAKPALAPVPERKYPVLKQRWTEHEREWGSRPDGETLHLTREDRDIYVRGYNATFNNRDAAPDEYTQADGEPQVIDVDAATFKKLLVQKTVAIVGPGYGFTRHGIPA